MYKCNNCGKLVEELEEIKGDYNNPSYVEDCCDCSGYYEEAYKCKECGEWFTKEELNGGICNDCLDNLIEIDIVVEYVKKYNLEQDIYEYLKEYIDCDREHFGMFLAKRGVKC